MAEEGIVLLVEDHADTRDVLKVLIASRGYAVVTAADGRQALELMRRAVPPRLIMLDLLLPRMTGWELLAEVRKSELLSEIPVVVVSGVEDDLMPDGPEIAERYRKPIRAEQLFAVLEKYLGPAPRGE